MKKFQQEMENAKRGTESAVDNVRGEYEQAVWGRRTTENGAEIFPEPEGEQNTGNIANNFYGNDHTININKPEPDKGMDI